MLATFKIFSLLCLTPDDFICLSSILLNSRREMIKCYPFQDEWASWIFYTNYFSRQWCRKVVTEVVNSSYNIV